MKNAIFLLALLFGVAFADECTYQTDENTYFTFLSTWSNVTDSKGNLFFFQDGCFGFAETNPCPENSPVCVILNGASDPISTAVTYSVDTSISQDQVQFVFTSETSCFSESIGEKATMKTTISFNCDMMNEVVTVTFDGCFVVINANSSTYCSDSDNYDSDSDFESGSFPSNASVDIEPGVVFSFFSMGIFIFFAFGLMISICLCCCCMVRRRRQKKIQTAMRQFSNVAFQPIPYTNPVRQPTQGMMNGHLPAYNPYVGQPQQFVYYIPAPQGQPAVVPLQSFGETTNQINESDEKFAKELQAQYDREQL